MLSMNSTFASNYVSLFNEALAESTIALKCEHLTRLLEEGSTKTLNQVFQQLLAFIFGIGHPGWAIPMTKATTTSDYVTIRNFLGPKGVLFKAIERLQQEGNYRYELPAVMYHTFGMPSGDYEASRQAVRVSAFHLYFYHFAFCIMNFSQMNSFGVAATAQQNQVPDENLYYALQEDYLNFYLPANGAYPPVNTSNSSSSSQPQTSSLNMSSFMMIRRPQNTTTTAANAANNLPTYHDMWRSELVVRIFADTWINTAVTAQQEAVVRVTRRLVKHLHQVSNAHQCYMTFGMCAEGQSMDQFLHSLNHYVQPKLLRFLVHCFETWPLDSSFRIVLETWLSYVQPWRYTTEAAHQKSNVQLSADREVANAWYSFIVTNLSFYNKLFTLAVTRFLRMDLSKQGNALLLFRVAKIFSQANLVCMVEEGELPPAYHTDNSLYPPPPATSFVANTHMISSKETQSLVRQLVTVCNQALGTIRRRLAQDSSKTCWQSFLSLFDSPDEIDPYRAMAGDAKKCEAYLTDSVRLLCVVFDCENMIQQPVSKESKSRDDFELFDANGTIRLDDRSRYELMNNMRKVAVLPKCAPELQPITSMECPPLVRLLYRASACVNRRYSRNLADLCSRPGFVGKFSRHLFAPAAAHHNMSGLSPVSLQRRLNVDQPRLNLRFLAHYRVLFYFTLLVLFCLATGTGFVSLSLKLVCLMAVYLVAEVLYFDYRNKKLV